MRRLINCPNTVFQAVRAEYLGLAQGDMCGAMLLNYFEQWQSSVGILGWMFRTQDQITQDLFALFSKEKIARAIGKLIKMGYINRRKNPKNKQDRTWQYQFQTFKVQTDVLEWLKTAPSNLLLGASNMTNQGIEGDVSGQTYNRITTDSKTDSRTDTEQTTEVYGDYAEPKHDGKDVVVSVSNPKQIIFPKANFGKASTVEATTQPTAKATAQNTPPDSAPPPPEVLALTVIGVKNAERFAEIPPAEVKHVIEASVTAVNRTGWIVRALEGRWYKNVPGENNLLDDSRYCDPENAIFFEPLADEPLANEPEAA